MTIRVEVVDASAVVDLRRAVLRPQFAPDAPMAPFGPPDALQLGAIDEDGTVIGTCLIFPEPYPTRPEQPGTWQLRGMATDTARHRGGIGSAVLAAADAQVRAHGGTLLWCNARMTALGFYERNGWVAEGEVFSEGPAQLPHRRMFRELPGVPTSSV